MRGQGETFNLMSPESPLTVWTGGAPGAFRLNLQLGSKGSKRPTVQGPQDAAAGRALQPDGSTPPGARPSGRSSSTAAVPERLREPLDAHLGRLRDPKRTCSMLGCGDRTGAGRGRGLRGVVFDAGDQVDGQATSSAACPRRRSDVETLLTPTPSDASHPYLPLVGEGRVRLRGKRLPTVVASRASRRRTRFAAPESRRR